ncbi:N-acetylgalactosaminyltransferase 7 [Eurytemora carolleeae]|uniref:N-acetylgalactosaminyltransferase 7 n=1 Tax=Eurytemora carolleeae TaxID=1294199 RepID=UPI000C79193A|nr:N-acetylgalactosaminyltransferase 7 [Eurytemora carolleeae]|eukprot:XP_023343361.1 N-acetylgalactosaminyltransferase 7-like [Eurytemora affinis]
MAVCRRTRLIKLIILSSILLGVLYLLLPDELTGLLQKFTPPPTKLNVNKQNVNKQQAQQNIARRQRSEHEPYLTPGNPGNFEPLRDEEEEGPGENGEPYHLEPELSDQVDNSINDYGMNMVASNLISLDRTIPDTRLAECKNWHYPTQLPKASVVIVFHNEGRSVLMRTVHSIINRTPSQFLEEILLVDDFSDRNELGEGLQNYLRIFRGVVRLIRNEERAGLIRSRTRGAEEAHGAVLVFLDAHCEVNRNWLPPLLAPIYRNYTTLTVPIIDGIDHETFEYKSVYSGSQHFRGIFEWGMLYKETELPEIEAKKREHESQPYPSPTHAGGLFAINRDYFLSLGGYDPGLLVWGGENFELSFKVWQCGGSVQWVPCSRVGHVYRAFMPYGFGKLTEGRKGPIITINYKRVVETWMDDQYKQFFYTREPLAKFADMGDISKQLELKKNLECKSFDWFINNIAPDMLHKYPKLPKNVAEGSLLNKGLKYCLDPLGREAPAVIGNTSFFLSHPSYSGNNQLVRLNEEGQLGLGERCIDATEHSAKLIVCPMGSVSGPWKYVDSTLQHSKYNKCLAISSNGENLILKTCKVDTTMQWTFMPVKPSWA